MTFLQSTRLLALAGKLNEECAGKVKNMVEASANRHELEKRLAAFEGIGPKTVEIFMREAAKFIRFSAKGQPDTGVDHRQNVLS